MTSLRRTDPTAWSDGNPTDIRTFPKPPAWVDDARCAETGDFGFYPKDGRADVSEVVAFCGGCPVRQRCFDYAVSNGETEGIWGGRHFGNRAARKRGAA